jgi:hypothetical protein
MRRRASVVKVSKSVQIRANPWPRVSLPPSHRRHFILAQIATDTALRPYPVPKNLPAPRTSPLRQPPTARQINPNPAHQYREVSGLSQLQLPNHEAQEDEAQKEHDHQISPRHVAVPRPPILFDILRSAFARRLVSFPAFEHGSSILTTALQAVDATVYSPSGYSDRNNRKTLYRFSSRTTPPSPAASAAEAKQTAAP